MPLTAFLHRWPSYLVIILLGLLLSPLSKEGKNTSSCFYTTQTAALDTFGSMCSDKGRGI